MVVKSLNVTDPYSAALKLVNTWTTRSEWTIGWGRWWVLAWVLSCAQLTDFSWHSWWCQVRSQWDCFFWETFPQTWFRHKQICSTSCYGQFKFFSKKYVLVNRLNECCAEGEFMIKTCRGWLRCHPLQVVKCVMFNLTIVFQSLYSCLCLLLPCTL